MTNPFERDLDRNPANYTPMTPLSLIARAAYTYPDRLAVVHGERRYTWAETYARSRRFADALVKAGIGVGDTVALMAANTPEMIEAHFAVPMTGGVLNTLNTRLDADAIAFMLEHGGAKVLVTDTEYSLTIERALEQLPVEAARHRHRRRAGTGRQAARRASTTRRSSPMAIRSSPGGTRRTSGMRSRSTTRPARRAIRRASSTITAARISMRCPTSSTGGCRGTRCTCGRCRCSTATAGASSGRWPPTPA